MTDAGLHVCHLHVTDPRRLPSGHAYLRIRNAGLVVHYDFHRKDVPWVERMRELIMDSHQEWMESEGAE